MPIMLIQQADRDDNKPCVPDVKAETRTGFDDVEVLVQSPLHLKKRLLCQFVKVESLLSKESALSGGLFA